MSEDLQLCEGIVHKDGKLIDMYLDRKISINAPLSPDDKRALNEMYYINLRPLFGSIVANLPFRIDVTSRSFLCIVVAIFRALVKKSVILLSLCLSIVGLVTGNLWIPFVALFFCDTLLAFCFHEALHLYFFRKFDTGLSGVVIVQRLHFFVLYPKKKLKDSHQLIISGLPPILSALAGFTIVGLAYGINVPPIFLSLIVLFAIPWMLQILSLLPSTTDFSGVADAITSIISKR